MEAHKKTGFLTCCPKQKILSILSIQANAMKSLLKHLDKSAFGFVQFGQDFVHGA
jgi:hypothetical protein